MEAQYFNREMDTISLHKLRELQNERLRGQVERCYRDILYYKKLFDRCGLKPQHIKTVDDLINIPTLEKKDLRALYPYGLIGVPLEKIYRFGASSGTTGVPMVFGFTEKDWKITLRDILGRIFTCFGMDSKTFLYQTFGYGLFLGGFLFEYLKDTVGATVFPAGPGRTLAAIHWLKDMKHNAIAAAPTFLQVLINMAKENGINPKIDWNLKIGAFGGEITAPEYRKRIVEQMGDGFTYNEQYGFSEVGPFCTHSCPDTREKAEMHVIADHFFLEVLNPATGKRVEPGEEGDLVFTFLTREAYPVIRWNTRDIAKLSLEPYGCNCGRVAHPKISRILGRSDEMLKIRSTIVFPSQIQDIVSSSEGATENWQIVLNEPKETLAKLRIEVEVIQEIWGKPGEMSKLKNHIEEELQARFGTTGEVVLMEPNSLPRDKEGKTERVIDRTKKMQD